MVNHERTFFNGFYAFPMTLSWISSCTLRGLFQTLSAFHTPRKTELHCVDIEPVLLPSRRVAAKIEFCHRDWR
jgi:hypothetical protein